MSGRKASKPRAELHRTGTLGGYTADYGIKRLVWFERHEKMETATPAREADQAVAARVEV
jgi:predicted GIY-YIG superfamily endonuclease